MTQEEKDLLLKDLCARLPYLVKGLYQWKGNVPFDRRLDGMLYDELYLSLYRTGDSSFKPYLRPMSSMTEEEKHKLLKFGAVARLENGEVVDVSCVGFERHADIQDYLNACHLDYRGLIDKGLALEAPEGMYK